jgi:lipopolysaccharide export system protein LptA
METSKGLSMKNRQFKIHSAALAYVLAFLTIVCASCGFAQDAMADRQAGKQKTDPIRITADKLVTDNRTNSAQFTGSVRAVQGQSILTADSLTLIFDSKGDESDTFTSAEGSADIKRIEARGNVRIEFDNRVAVGEQAVYITSERKLVLKGPGAKVISGKDEVVGSTITFYRDDGRVSMEGDGKDRVKAIIHSDQRGLN